MSIEEKNKEVMLHLVEKYFYLKNESMKRFEQELCNKHVDDKYKSILNGAENLRYELPIPEINMSIFDTGWKCFKGAFQSFCREHAVSYSAFRNNKIKIGGQEIKLHKALVSFYKTYGLSDAHNFVQKEMEMIGSTKLPVKNSIKLVLSLNFADWFLSSTAEKWTSCINLESDYSGAYWSGLPGTIVDKNRAMLYLTDGEKKNYKGIEVDRILSRSWVLLDKDDMLNVINFYPSKLLTTADINEIFEKKYFTNIYNDFEAKHYIDFLMYGNNCVSFIYQDNTHFDENYNMKMRGGESGYYYLNENGRYAEADIFNFCGGVEMLERKNISIGETDNKICCEECGETVHEDEAYYDNDGYAYCEYCFDRNFIICKYCDNTVRKEDSQYVEDYQGNICSNCIEDKFGSCDECGEYHEFDYIFYVDCIDKYFCEDCLEKAVKKDKICKCDNCKEFVFFKDIRHIKTMDENICEGCLQNAINAGQLKFNFQFERVTA